MQGLEQTTMPMGPGRAQSSEKSVIKSEKWKESKEKFLKGEPKVLGVVQIMIALINLSLGIIMMADHNFERPISVFLMAPIWGPIMYIISGSLTIAAGVRTTNSLVVSSLSLNTISSVLAAVASIMGVVSLAVGAHHPFIKHNTIFRGLDGLILTLNLLQFCIAVSVSAFGCQASCCNSSDVLVVLPSNPAVTVVTTPMTFQPLLSSEHQGKNVPENVFKNHPREIV